MKHYLVFALLLVGCGCAQQPILPEAQLQMSSLMSSYKLAHEVEKKFCFPEKSSQPCLAARTAGFNVEAAITVANGNRTQATIEEAQRKMGAYEVAIGEVL